MGFSKAINNSENGSPTRETTDQKTADYYAVKYNDKTQVELIKDRAPNGVEYPLLKKHTPAVGDAYAEELRHPDYDNPILDSNGNVRFYRYLPVSNKFMKVTTESNAELIQAIKDDWLVSASSAVVTGGAGGFGIIELLLLIVVVFISGGGLYKIIKKKRTEG